METVEFWISIYLEVVVNTQEYRGTCTSMLEYVGMVK